MNDEDLLFVPTENAPQEYAPEPRHTEDTQNKPIKKKSKLKLWLIFGISAFLIISVVLTAFVIIFSNNESFIKRETDIVLFTTAEGKILICNNGRKIDTELQGRYVDKSSSLGGDVCMFWVVPADSVVEDARELYCVKNNKVTRVAADIENYSLSSQGKAAAYITYPDTLYKTNLDGKKPKQIATGVTNYAISPDGSSIVYTVSGYGSAQVYCFNGKESTLIGKDFPQKTSVISVSDKGSCIFIKSGDEIGVNTLYRYTKNDKKCVELCNDLYLNDYYGFVYINSESTQLLYFTPDKKTYVATPTGAVTELYQNRLKLVLPSNVITVNNTVGIKNFFDCFYTSDGNSGNTNIHYVDKKGNETKLVLDVTNIQISYDGDYVYYLRDRSDLCKVKAKAGAKGTTLAADIENYKLTENKNKFYFEKNDNLYYGSGDKFKRFVKGDVFSFTVISDDVCIISCEDGLLRHTGLLLKKFSGKNHSLSIYPNSAYYVDEVSDNSDEYILFATDGKRNFEFIASSEYFKEFK
ncbi:MAG: hypothetical protein E7384_02345 [Ruminococcaceae bacterium]|nr:hypothetical protein [Oscillospiraceae bacterium]